MNVGFENLGGQRHLKIGWLSSFKWPTDSDNFEALDTGFLGEGAGFTGDISIGG